jgi:putative transcriptional regulator
MKKRSITRFKLNPNKPPKTDWRSFDAMTDEERHRAAVSDTDAPPATEAQLARACRVPTVRALRKQLNLTQEQFAARFHLPLGTVRDWEQGAHRPDKAAQVLLAVIAREPDAVARALEPSRLDRMRGTATSGLTTDEIMALTRDESEDAR